MVPLDLWFSEILLLEGRETSFANVLKTILYNILTSCEIDGVSIKYKHLICDSPLVVNNVVDVACLFIQHFINNSEEKLLAWMYINSTLDCLNDEEDFKRSVYTIKHEMNEPLYIPIREIHKPYYKKVKLGYLKYSQNKESIHNFQLFSQFLTHE